MIFKFGMVALIAEIVISFFYTEANIVKPEGPWFNHRYQFYIHNVSKAWGETETICSSTGPGVSLLTVHDALAWDMWKHLLGPLHQEPGKYWFGLTAISSNGSFEFFWSGCEDSFFLTPLAPDFDPQNETCVYMWVHREVFVGVYQDRWYYGQDCLSEAPFICSVHLPERACLPRTCDDVIVPMNATNCTDLLCDLLSQNLTCSYHFLDGFCHLWVNNTNGENTVRTICFHPNTEETMIYCPEVNKLVNYTIEVGSVDDNCPVYMEPMNISSLFETKHYMYYKRRTSWNSAREICNLQNATLLTFADEEDMEKWLYILTATLLIDDGPWLGLHVPDLTSPVQLLWDDCSTSFLHGSGESLNASCIAFTHQGIHLATCNESRPFICEFELTETSCQSASCNDIFLSVNETDCDDALCSLQESCFLAYLSPEGICQLHNNVSSNTSASCFVPRNVSERCNETVDLADTYFTAPDNNTEVTDTKCSGGNSTTIQPITICPPRQRSCPCNCDLVSPFLHERADDEVVLTVEERIEQIVSELTVDKKNTSLNRMKYMSASDNRRSSVGIGAMAALIIFSVFGVIVLIDLSRIFHDIKHAFRGLFSVLGLHGLQSALKLQTAPNKTTRDASETASATSTALSNLSVSSLLYTETSGNMDSALSQIFEIDNSVGDNIPPVSTSLA